MRATAALHLGPRDLRKTARTAVRQGIENGIPALRAFALLGGELLLERRGITVVVV